MREWIATTTFGLYQTLLPAAWIALALVVCVLLPLAAWRKTRSFAGMALFLVSWLFGITTWLLGAAISFSAFGWLGLIIGLVFAGIGVVPLGIVGAFFKMGVPGIGVGLLVMLAITLISRYAGMYFITRDR